MCVKTSERKRKKKDRKTYGFCHGEKNELLRETDRGKDTQIEREDNLSQCVRKRGEGREEIFSIPSTEGESGCETQRKKKRCKRRERR
jgi:hypothetical protein